jgi:Plasmid pRiA4b ORF-3-like protein
VVPADAQPALWDSQELRRLARLRQLAVDTGAPDEAIRLIESAATADEAVEELVSAGLMPDEAESLEGMLAWFTPLLEPGCDQVEAEVCGAEFVAELRRAGPGEAGVGEVLSDVLEHLIECKRPEALAMARVMAAVGPPEVRAIASDMANRLVAGGRADQPWSAGLGQPAPGPCFGYADIYGYQRSIVVAFSYARKKHAVVVLIDYLLGGGIKDCFVADYTSKLRDDYRKGTARPEVRFSDLDAATAREILEKALSRDPCPAEADQIQNVGNYIDLVRARVELLPRRSTAAGVRSPAARGKRPAAARNVHRLKVTLRGTKPPIWRRFEVPSDITLARLHAVIQLGFGWQDSHLWVFETPAGRYGSYDPELEISSAASKKLSAVADWPADKIRYEYDFGDSWEHDVVVEAVQPAEPGVAYPRCTAGRRAGPPEDSGGVWGYYDLLNTLANPRHDNHAQTLSWLGIESAAEFDPGGFDLEAVNTALARISKVLSRS